jgi:hypothetical protein
MQDKRKESNLQAVKTWLLSLSYAACISLSAQKKA